MADAFPFYSRILRPFPGTPRKNIVTSRANRGKNVAVHFFHTHRETAALLALLALAIFSGQSLAADASDVGWTLSSHGNGVAIYSRVHAGTGVKEFKAVGDIEAPPRAVQAVLDDVEAYPHFMPFVVECRVISRDADSIVSYQRISPPLCADRDYTLRVWHENERAPGGRTFRSHWEAANALGPAERPKVVRVKINEGSWLLEPDGENKTCATYRVYTDTGGALPAFIANKANQVGIEKIFAAMRQQVKEAKYNR